MKAAIVREHGAGFEIADIDVAEPVGREVLVEVKASGLCHSDELAASFPIPGFAPPMVLGHEMAGEVTAIGSDVTEFAVGDHVVGCLLAYCGRCVKCLSGRPFLCVDPTATARTSEQAPRLSEAGNAVTQGMDLGGFAQQALVHENHLVAIPHEVPWPQAALLGCGVVTGAGAVLNAADVRAGDSVVVVGVGGVGLNALNGAVTAGAATIIAIDLSDDKLERAKAFGATHVINSSDVDPVEAVRAITGAGADAVFDFVGLSPVLAQAYEMVAPGGGLFVLGSLDLGASLEISSVEILNAKKKVQGVYMGSTTPKRDIPMYAQLYLAGRFELDGLVSKEIGLSEINEGYASLKDPGIARVVVTDLTR